MSDIIAQETEEEKQKRIYGSAFNVAIADADPEAYIKVKTMRGEMDEVEAEAFRQIAPEAKEQADLKKANIFQTAVDGEIAGVTPDAILKVKAIRGEWGELENNLYLKARDRVVSNPEEAKKIHDERIISEHAKRLKKHPRLTQLLGVGAKATIRDARSLLARLEKDDEAVKKIREEGRLEEAAASRVDVQSPGGSVTKHLRGATRSFTTMMPLLATGSGLGAALGLGGKALAAIKFGTMATGFTSVRADQAASEADESGLTGSDKTGFVARAAAIEGLVQTAFQVAGLGGMEKIFAGGGGEVAKTSLKSFLLSTGLQFGAEQLEEMTTEILDQYNQMGSRTVKALTTEQMWGRDKEGNFGVGWQILKDTMIQTGIVMGLTSTASVSQFLQTREGVDAMAKSISQRHDLDDKTSRKVIQKAIDGQEKGGVLDEILGREIAVEELKTDEGVRDWVERNPGKADEISNTKNPSRNQVKDLGLPEIEDRTEFSNDVKNIVDEAKKKAKEPTEAPAEPEAVKIKEIAKAIKVSEKEEYEIYGLRVQAQKAEVGEVITHRSTNDREFIGDPSEEADLDREESGVYMITIDTRNGLENGIKNALEEMKGYQEIAPEMLVLGAYTHYGGPSIKEDIAENPVVLSVIKNIEEVEAEAAPVKKKKGLKKVKPTKKETDISTFFEDRINRLKKRGLTESAKQFSELAKQEAESRQKGIFEEQKEVVEKKVKARPESTDEAQELVLLKQEMEAAELDTKEISKLIKDQEKTSQLDLFPEPDQLFEEKADLEAGKIPETLSDVSAKAEAEGKAQTEGLGDIEKAAVEAGKTVDEFIEEFNIPIGLSIKKVKKTVSDEVKIPESVSKDVEKRWQAAKGIKQPGVFSKVKDFFIKGKQSTKHFPHLDSSNPMDAGIANILRIYQNIPQYTKAVAENSLKGLTAGLGKNQYDIFERNVILADLLGDIDTKNDAGVGMYDNKELPFGYKNRDEVAQDTKQFAAIARANPEIQKALDKRNAFMDTLRNELVDNAILPKSALDRENYFHHQVLEYMNAKDFAAVSPKGIKQGKRGWQKKRWGSMKDYNTDYVQSEFEVIADALAQLETVKTLTKIKTIADLSPELKATAKENDVKVSEITPDGYTTWKPHKGLKFYQANSLTEQVLKDVLEGNRQLEQEDVLKVIAVGRGVEWIIPKNIADTLDTIVEHQPGGFIENLSRNTLNTWKQWVLLNPYRVMKYNINNMSGDMDIAFAYDPKIIGHGFKAARDLIGYRRGKGATSELLLALKLGVIDSGLTAVEIPDISKAGFFRIISGDKPNLIQKYWNTTKNFTQWRENILRLAAFRYFKKKLASGKQGVYGASKPSEVDAVKDPTEKAAKLARELIGDYGNLSESGQWIRQHMIPFWSFQEINARRYMQLMANVAKEGRKTGGAYKGFKLARFGANVAWNTGKLAILANAMSAMVSLWNHTFFPEEEEELSDQFKRQGHIIFGRREDGTIISLRFRGALTDALEWFGGEDYIADINDVRKGDATIWEKAAEVPEAIGKKVISGLRPEPKLLFESLTKKALFPDPFKPRPVRDVTENILKTFSADRIYRLVTGKPMRSLSEELQGVVLYNTDPGEAAYRDVKSLSIEFLKEKGREFPSITPSERSNALYYFKQALRYGDKKATQKWYGEYMKLGGTPRGMNQSIKLSTPDGSVPKKLKDEFLDSLSEKETQELEKANEWYNRNIKIDPSLEKTFRKGLKKKPLAERQTASFKTFGKDLYRLAALKQDDPLYNKKLKAIVEQLKNNPEFENKEETLEKAFEEAKPKNLNAFGDAYWEKYNRAMDIIGR